jgi:hypothetical protein
MADDSGEVQEVEMELDDQTTEQATPSTGANEPKKVEKPKPVRGLLRINLRVSVLWGG